MAARFSKAMVQAKILWARRLKQLLFMALLLSILFLSAALSLMPIPFLPQPFLIHFYGAICFVALLYLPPKFWIFLLISSLWLDLMLHVTLGAHAFLMVLQYGFILFMRGFLKEYGFFTHWGIFTLSFIVIFCLLSPFSFAQSFLTILMYPLILTGFLKFLSRFKQVAHG